LKGDIQVSAAAFVNRDRVMGDRLFPPSVGGTRFVAGGR
jgi:hypothetical protein